MDGWTDALLYKSCPPFPSVSFSWRGYLGVRKDVEYRYHLPGLICWRRRSGWILDGEIPPPISRDTTSSRPSESVMDGGCTDDGPLSWVGCRFSQGRGTCSSLSFSLYYLSFPASHALNQTIALTSLSHSLTLSRSRDILSLRFWTICPGFPGSKGQVCTGVIMWVRNAHGG